LIWSSFFEKLVVKEETEAVLVKKEEKDSRFFSRSSGVVCERETLFEDKKKRICPAVRLQQLCI
jgi:hypothetical protein